MIRLSAHAAAAALALGLCALVPHASAHDLPLDSMNTSAEAKKTLLAKLEAASAADPKNHDLRFQVGALLCDLGNDGDEKAADQAVALFKAMNAESPKDAEVLAYYGNACVIYAQYAFLLFKGSWANDGFKHLDDAETAAPDNLNVRLLRAINSNEVPDFLNRDKVAGEDFAWLLKRYADHPADFSKNFLRTLFYYAGKYKMKHNDPDCVQLFAQAVAQPVPQDDTMAPKMRAALDAATAKIPSKTPVRN